MVFDSFLMELSSLHRCLSNKICVRTLLCISEVDCNSFLFFCFVKISQGAGNPRPWGMIPGRGGRCSRIQMGTGLASGLRFGRPLRIRSGHGMRFRFNRIMRTCCSRSNQIGVETEFAVAAVAARAAFFAEMVGARIFRAGDADAGGFFFADAADKGHSKGHWVFRFAPPGVAG